MTYPNDYFQEEPKRPRQKRQWQRQGIVAEVETNWGIYTIYSRNSKTWIEAYGHGGKERRMPQVDTVEAAKEIVWKQTRPLQSDVISF